MALRNVFLIFRAKGRNLNNNYYCCSQKNYLGFFYLLIFLLILVGSTTCDILKDNISKFTGNCLQRDIKIPVYKLFFQLLCCEQVFAPINVHIGIKFELRNNLPAQSVILEISFRSVLVLSNCSLYPDFSLDILITSFLHLIQVFATVKSIFFMGLIILERTLKRGSFISGGSLLVILKESKQGLMQVSQSGLRRLRGFWFMSKI